MNITESRRNLKLKQERGTVHMLINALDFHSLCSVTPDSSTCSASTVQCGAGGCLAACSRVWPGGIIVGGC